MMYVVIAAILMARVSDRTAQTPSQRARSLVLVLTALDC